MLLETSPPRPRRATAAAAAALALGLALAGAAPALAQSPQVLDVTPPSSPTQGGARMTIMGLDFGAAAGTVQIGGRDFPVAAGDWTATQIRLDIPEGEPGPTLLRVRRASGHVSNVWQGFSYEPPQLTRFSPDQGPARGGVLITVHGANFGTQASGKVARMGGKIAPCQWISHEELRFALPNLPPGTRVDGWVEVNGLATGTVPFTVEAPIVTDVSPMPGPTQGGVLITITGSNFGMDGEDPAPIVDISGEPCAVLARVSDAEIQALTAPGSGASRPLTIRVGTGQPGPAFSYAYMPPYVGATEPAPGPAYSSFPITIHGSNFGPPGTAVEALLHSPHGTGTTVIQCSPTDHFRAVGQVPPLAPGTYALEVFVVDQSSQAVPYTIGGTPVISGYGPTNGPTEGGTRITIFGEHFGGVPVAVHLGPWECIIDTWTDNAIECYTPPGYGGTFFELRVQAPGGEQSNPGYFQYDPPQLLEVDPMFLSPAGGQVITLRGENFGIPGAPLLVDFSGVPASIAQWVSHHEVRVTTPPGEPNQVGLACLRMGPAGEATCEDFQYGNPVGVEPPPLPGAFGLRLAGANPSRGPTAFAVDLPRDARWRLHVFDSAGRLVRRFEGDAPAGTHAVSWDGADARGARAPSGLYWARLEVAGETFVRKAMRL
jgi:hypothetical protein